MVILSVCLLILLLTGFIRTVSINLLCGSELYTARPCIKPLEIIKLCDVCNKIYIFLWVEHPAKITTLQNLGVHNKLACLYAHRKLCRSAPRLCKSLKFLGVIFSHLALSTQGFRQIVAVKKEANFAFKFFLKIFWVKTQAPLSSEGMI